MATIVTQTADNACHIQDAFRAAGRDDYPQGVYEAIFDIINNTRCDDEVYHLDVIEWCCDMSETSLTDSDLDDIDDIDELADRLCRETTVLYADADAGTVYHLAY